MHGVAICALPAEIGRCESEPDYHKRWYYDDLRGTCLSFIYTGCAGNQNNFRSIESCLDFCRRKLQKQPLKINVTKPLKHISFQLTKLIV